MTNVTMDLVDAIGEAFNANNIDAVMKFFSQDAVFDHAVGPDVHGLRFEGAEAIRAVLPGCSTRLEPSSGTRWIVPSMAIRPIASTAVKRLLRMAQQRNF